MSSLFFPLKVQAGPRHAMSVSFTLDPWAGPSLSIWKAMNIILTLHISTAFASLFHLLGRVCLLKSIFFKKNEFQKMNYFLMFGSVMKNKLENTFQCLVMS